LLHFSASSTINFPESVGEGVIKVVPQSGAQIEVQVKRICTYAAPAASIEDSLEIGIEPHGL
jgi:hypothetical protein